MNKTNIIVGVGGGISSYKTCYLIRLLRKEKFSVKVVMTPNATHFITPLVFETLSGNPVYVDMFKERKKELEHISLAEWCHLCIVAPLTCNTLSKIAHGICDNLLTTLILALPPRIKIILAPAMDENMWKNPITQENLKKLEKIKRYIILKPQKGELASGKYGEGRMVEPSLILETVKKLTKRK